MDYNDLDLNGFPNEVRPFDLNELPDLELEEMDGFGNYDLFSEDHLEVDEHVFQSGELGDSIIDRTVDQANEENEHHEADPENTPCGSECQKNRYTFLSNVQRQMVYNALLERSVNGKLKRNTTKEVSSLLSVNVQMVRRIWKRAKDTPYGIPVDVSHKRTKNCGRKRKDVGLDRLPDIPLHRRRTLRSLSQFLNVCYSTLHKRLKEGLIRRHSNSIKPLLKKEHKIARLQFCLSMLERSSLPHNPTFVDMYNVVHTDEKWFYMSKKSNLYYLLPQEEAPLRTCQSKNFIGKVMFLAAVARPRFDDVGNEVFSGKIGVFPLVTKHPALRRSRNRDAGTLETKPITSVKKETIRAFLVEKVIPAIQAKWPREDAGKTIFIQQDNARTHFHPNDEEFQRAASPNGFDIRLTCQPANSPDLNVLDLGFFNAIQSLQDKECPKSVDELIHVVEKSFEEYPTSRINHVFLTLQLCMVEIMRKEGSNKYEIPHINKTGLERSGCLPKQITCDYALVENVMNNLATMQE